MATLLRTLLNIDSICTVVGDSGIRVSTIFDVDADVRTRGVNFNVRHGFVDDDVVVGDDVVYWEAVTMMVDEVILMPE